MALIVIFSFFLKKIVYLGSMMNANVLLDFISSVLVFKDWLFSCPFYSSESWGEREASKYRADDLSHCCQMTFYGNVDLPVCRL